MPTSDLYNITSIMTIVCNLKPHTVLDIGCGFGKYGILMREYLDIWQQRLRPESWQTKIFGIEAFSNYRSPIYDYVYNNVYHGDVRKVLPILGNFDLILMADVIEHFEKEEAIQLLNSALEQSSVVIISTPREFYAQGESHGNEGEIHRCLFQLKDFPSHSQVVKKQALSCDIFIASKKNISKKILYPAGFEDLLYLRQRSTWRKFGFLGAGIARTLKFLNSL